MASIYSNNVIITGPKQAFHDAFVRTNLFAPDQPVTEEAVNSIVNSEDFTLGHLLVTDRGNWRDYNIYDGSEWGPASMAYEEQGSTARIRLEGPSEADSLQPWAKNFIDEIPEKRDLLCHISCEFFDDDYSEVHGKESYAWNGKRWFSSYDPKEEQCDDSFEPLAESECRQLRCSGKSLRVRADYLLRLVQFYRPKVAYSQITEVGAKISGRPAIPKAMTLAPRATAMHAWVEGDKNNLLAAPISECGAAQPCILPYGTLKSMEKWLLTTPGLLTMYCDGEHLLIENEAASFSAKVAHTETEEQPTAPISNAEHLTEFIPSDWMRVIDHLKSIIDEQLGGEFCTDKHLYLETRPDTYVAYPFDAFVRSLSTMSKLWKGASLYKLPNALCICANSQEHQIHEYIIVRPLPPYDWDLEGYCKRNVWMLMSNGHRYLPGIWYWDGDVEDEVDEYEHSVIIPYGYDNGGEIHCRTFSLEEWKESVAQGAADQPQEEP